MLVRGRRAPQKIGAVHYVSRERTLVVRGGGGGGGGSGGGRGGGGGVV